ncbi:MAG: hypothetical protein BKP49_02260 [Treponema sp. CETP13]|nr:MAG: hypothetical protein BKP49_02260 [Treponema sp. CETP13]
MYFSLCDLIADITQNSVEANAQKITIQFIQSEKELSVIIKDDGSGMAPQTLKKIQDPFYTDGKKHPKRKIGMGIPFLIQTAQETNGKWNIESKENIGTTVTMRFDLTNIDTPPIGDVPELFRQLFILPGNQEMIITRIRTGIAATTYTVVRSQLIETLGNINTVSNLALLKQFLQSQEQPEN